MGFLGPALLAAAKARGAYNQGKSQATDAENQQRLMVLKLALEERNRNQPKAASWDVRETENGLVRINPMTGEVAPLTLGDKPLLGKQKASDSPKLQHVVTEDGIYAFNPEDGSASPVVAGGKPLRPPKQKWEVYGPGGGSEPSWQVVQTDEGIKQINPKTGEVRDVTQGGKPLSKPIDAATKRQIQDADDVIFTIDNAIKELEAHPKAVGLLRGRVTAIDQKFDPEGSNARAGISDVASKITLQRSGGAVSDQEFARIAPFIPSPHDLNAGEAKKKLLRLRENFSRKKEMLGGGAATPGATPDLKPNDAPVSGFAAESARLNRQYEAAVERGVDPVKAQEVLDRELGKLRLKYPRR